MFFNSNMSFSERERFAYANGDFVLADEQRSSAELEDQVAELEERIDIVEKEAFQRGHDEGFGIDHAEALKDMESERDRAKETAEKSKVLVRSLLQLFHTDAMKTVAGRKQIHNQLQGKLIQLGY